MAMFKSKRERNELKYAGRIRKFKFKLDHLDKDDPNYDKKKSILEGKIEKENIKKKFWSLT